MAAPGLLPVTCRMEPFLMRHLGHGDTPDRHLLATPAAGVTPLQARRGPLRGLAAPARCSAELARALVAWGRSRDSGAAPASVLRVGDCWTHEPAGCRVDSPRVSIHRVTQFDYLNTGSNPGARTVAAVRPYPTPARRAAVELARPPDATVGIRISGLSE